MTNSSAAPADRRLQAERFFASLAALVGDAPIRPRTAPGTTDAVVFELLDGGGIWTFLPRAMHRFGRGDHLLPLLRVQTTLPTLFELLTVEGREVGPDDLFRWQGDPLGLEPLATALGRTSVSPLQLRMGQGGMP